jgi:tRNA threonylcarbamoyladenosine biosynthesis protein TsaB
MIRGLAIETSSREGEVCLLADQTELETARFAHGLRNAAEILCLIDELCGRHTWAPASIRHVYVSAGPGSFTGLRIGITLAKALALATQATVVAVPTSRVLVENAPREARHVVIVLDARRGQIYTARFERSPIGWHEAEPAHVDTLTAVLARAGRPVHLLGEGIPYHQHLIPPDSRIITTPPELWQPRAAVVGRLGWQMARGGHCADILRLIPIYLRPPEAQEKLLAGGAGGGAPM